MAINPFMPPSMMDDLGPEGEPIPTSTAAAASPIRMPSSSPIPRAKRVSPDMGNPLPYIPSLPDRPSLPETPAEMAALSSPSSPLPTAPSIDSMDPEELKQEISVALQTLEGVEFVQFIKQLAGGL